MKRMLILLMTLSLITACGARTFSSEQDDSADQGGEQTDFASESAEEDNDDNNDNILDESDDRADVNIPSGLNPFVLAASFLDPNGSLMTIDTGDNNAVGGPHLLSDSSDTLIRSFIGMLFIVNRGTASVQTIDPSNYSIVANFSVGGGSNPQDINVISSSKAYVSRLDAHLDGNNSDDIKIVNPTTGTELGSIDLTQYTDVNGDRLARAGQMVLVGNKLLVLMQDLSLAFQADYPGKVAVIDTNTDKVTKVIELDGYNPSDITYSPLNDIIYVANTGQMINFAVDINDDTGGIETIDPVTFETEGITLDDKNLGGVVSEVRIASDDTAYTFLDFTKIAAFDPVDMTAINSAVYVSPGFFLPDFTLDRGGNILIAETDFNDPGIVFVDGESWQVDSGPIAVGAPPTSLTFLSE
ncbi:MAG: hypothetical protein HN337_06505 [Deltaproteobacteria bacterium]|jgi:hypothetical protein|nr:hypothetical protein [Deltaproteobacteria bacterium]